jgi:1-deoxy-D-xylulose-5-phosphate reductoisomerase
VIHPQSVIHSMVQYKDGSVLAQLGNPDMCTPIAHALAYPNRIPSSVEPLDFFSVGEFSFIIVMMVTVGSFTASRRYWR